MIVHALVEGPSEKAFLEPWAKRLLKGHELRAYPHQGKGKLQPGRAERTARGLLDQLPAKLAAFGRSLQRDQERVLVLVDADNDDVAELKRQLDALEAALDPAPVVVFRFAIEEMEAFYLADLKALAAAFPDFDRALAQSYVPDSICGTWELFGRVVGDGGGNKPRRASVRPQPQGRRWPTSRNRQPSSSSDADNGRLARARWGPGAHERALE